MPAVFHQCFTTFWCFYHDAFFCELSALLGFLFVFLILAAPASDARAATLSAGVGRAEITPDPDMVNWVHREPYDGVLDPIDAQVVVLEYDEDRVVILT